MIVKKMIQTIRPEILLKYAVAGGHVCRCMRQDRCVKTAVANYLAIRCGSYVCFFI